MQVIAIATPRRPDWRWRIVDYAGEIVEESFEAFPTIAAAVDAGAERLRKMDAANHSPRLAPHRRPPYLRGR